MDSNTRLDQDMSQDVRRNIIKRSDGSNNITDDLSSDYLPDKITDALWIYVSPILLCIGTIGNVLSILVLLRKPMRSSTTMFYLTCLSFGDLFTLYTGLLRYWISAAFDTDVRNLSEAGCKIHTFLVYMSLDFTVWILVSVTVDRCLSVSIPFKARRICTIQRSRMIVALTLFVMLLKNMHFLWNLKVVDTWETRCHGKTENIRNFLLFIWPWIDFSTFCLVPFSIMIVCNIKIIYEIFESQKKIDAHRNSNIEDNGTKRVLAIASNTNANLSDSDARRSVRFEDERTEEVAKTNGEQPKRKQPRHLSRLTITLLTINCVFLVTTSPIQAFLIGEEYWFANRTAEEIAWYNFWWAIVNILQYSNNCVHFFLYCLTGPRFRYELKCMLKRNRRIAVMEDYISGAE